VRSESTDPVVRICSNQSSVVGEEAAQLYVGYNDSRVERAVKELKGFSKVHLEPGQTKRVDFLLAAKQLAYYDEQQARWIVEPLTYSVHAGPSSKTEDLLSTKFRVRAKL